MPIPVRLCYSDTGTGERVTLDTTIQELTVEQVIEALKRDVLEQSGELGEWFSTLTNQIGIVHGPNLGFIFCVEDSYFGKTIIEGIAYTSFR